MTIPRSRLHDVRTTAGPPSHVLVTARDATLLCNDLWNSLAPTLRIAALVATPDEVRLLGAVLPHTDNPNDQ